MSLLLETQQPTIKQNFKQILSFLTCLSIFSYFAYDLEYHQQWGMEVVLYLQKHRNLFFDAIMRFGSWLGFEIIVIVVPLMLWSGKKRIQKLGLQMITIFIYMFFIQSLLKLYFLEPRPSWVNKEIQRDSSGDLEWSFPSAHAWAASLVWFYVANYLQTNKWVWMGAYVFPVFVSLSRVYFGVHYPHDVMSGYCCGVMSYIISVYIADLNLSYHSHFIAGIVMGLITLQFDYQTTNHQNGLWFAPTCLIGMHMNSWIFGLDRLWKLEWSIGKMFLNAFVGLPGVAVIYMAARYFHHYYIVKLLAGTTTPVLLLSIAPVVFSSLTAGNKRSI